MAKLFDVPPNIVLIITDQQRNYQHWPKDFWKSLGSTKWFEGKNSINFHNAIIGASMCSPSRGAFWTSSYQPQNGVYDTSTQSLDNSFPNLLHYVKSKGYDVEYRGKWHLLGKCETKPRPTSTSLNLAGAQNWDPPDGGLGFPDSLGGGTSDYDDRYLADNGKGIVDFINNYDSQSDNPFMLVASFVNPHDIMSFTDIMGSTANPANNCGYTYEPQGIPSPPPNQEPSSSLEYKPRLQKQLTSKAPAATSTELYVNFYAQLTKQVDSQVTDVLNALESNGLCENTLIIRFADHGEQAYSHHLVEKAGNCYEETINVPLYFSHPELTKATEALSQTVSLLDITPTIADIVFGDDVIDKTLAFDTSSSYYDPVPSNFTVNSWQKSSFPIQGLSMGALLANPNIVNGPVHSEGVIFCYDDEWAGKPAIPYKVRCLRTDNWKYSIYSTPADNSNITKIAGNAGPPYENGAKGRGPFDYELYYLVADSSLQDFPAGMPDYMKNLLVPTKGTDSQELINLANPDFSAVGGKPSKVEIDTYWNPYVQPIWTKVHNQLLNQMLDMNAMPLGSNGYLASSEWAVSGSPSMYATTSWPYRVTPTWMQSGLAPN